MFYMFVLAIYGGYQGNYFLSSYSKKFFKLNCIGYLKPKLKETINKILHSDTLFESMYYNNVLFYVWM